MNREKSGLGSQEILGSIFKDKAASILFGTGNLSHQGFGTTGKAFLGISLVNYWIKLVS